jgi:ketosteroid isomerase-like protein
MTEPLTAEAQAFLDDVLPRQLTAERALHDGDLAPRLAMWTRDDPVTLFGAWRSGAGWDQVSPVFDAIADSFSECTSYDIEVVAAGASGDLAYLVCYEHTSASVNGEPRTYTLRVTQVYRRENGEWKTVHRHGDTVEPAS